ncbi:hypothetical protein CCMSSC00406_0004887 [Pleurotus cornucopiae]|uniref:Uncharacterized protein n=1 Tax=Pleurotus cornucopiae TaxID=5321 RepID=A0ACB7J022_PLECO|nr:hypothetical protein CCMSSC00406_0004887 [Pleurotus cornucopiae]
MQFSLRLKLLPVVALAAMVIASPAATSRDVEASIVSDAEFDNWLRTTDADITFVGNAKALAERNALNTRVVYCSSRSGSAPSALWPQPTSRSATELGAEEVVTHSIPAGRGSTGGSAPPPALGRLMCHSLDLIQMGGAD